MPEDSDIQETGTQDVGQEPAGTPQPLTSTAPSLSFAGSGEGDTEEPAAVQEDGVATAMQPVSRWRVSAESDGPQGADGVGLLARSALDRMRAGDWESDMDPPSMPVHEYDRARPSGQAYKAIWGYDAKSRTERSCCGAACYTFRIPGNAQVDAYELTADTEVAEGKTYYTRTGSGTEQDPYAYAEVADPEASGLPGYYEHTGVARLLSVKADVDVDRYCDKGAVLYAELSDFQDPPALESIYSSAQSATAWFATGMQRDADGNPVAPNRRTADGGIARFQFDGDGAAPKPYLHVFLLLADYLGTRGTWIEGGAMFAAEECSVVFSRAVEQDSGADELVLTPLNIGRLPQIDTEVVRAGRQEHQTDTGESVGGGWYTARYYPLISFAYTWTMNIEPALIASLGEGAEKDGQGGYVRTIQSTAGIVRSMLALLYINPSAYDHATAHGVTVLSGRSAGQSSADSSGGRKAWPGDGGDVSLTYTAPAAYKDTSDGNKWKFSTRGAASLSFFSRTVIGLTGNRTYRGIVFERPVNPDGGGNTLPLRLCVYGIADASAVSAEASPPTATIVPCWQSLLSRDFRAGLARTMKIYNNPNVATGALTGEALSSAAGHDIAVTPLAAIDCTGQIDRIPFTQAWQSGEMSAIVIAAIPNGVPSGSVGGQGSEAVEATVSRAVSLLAPNAGITEVTRSEIAQTAGNVSTRVWASYTPPNGQTAAQWLSDHGIIPRWQGGAENPSWKSTANLPLEKTVTMKLKFRVSMTVTFSGVDYVIDESFTRATNVSWYFNLWKNLRPSSLGHLTNAAYCYGNAFPVSGIPVTGRSASGQTRSFLCNLGFVTLTMGTSAQGDNVFNDWCQTIDPYDCATNSFDIDTENISGSLVASVWKEYDLALSDVTLSTGYTYAWATRNAGAAQADATVDGKVSAVFDGVKYTASLQPRRSSVKVSSPATTDAYYASGTDRTMRRTVAGTLPADEQTLTFSNGASIVTARVVIPAQPFDSASSDWGGPRYITSKGVYNRSAETVGKRTAHDSGQTAQRAESLNVTQRIDLGTVSLYE